jgi:para-nitrobenzyl esterase
MRIHARGLGRAMQSFGAMLFLAAMTDAVAAQVRTEAGSLEGSTSPDGKVQAFKGIPYAAPPVGALRWKEPQPVPNWQGVRKATEFGARCMQGNVFGDMVFRDAAPSEDCLYLNVWTPKASPDAKLPVMVWIYGGGFQAGATSEPRQDGERLAHKGVVVVSMNYRLGIFGFFSHPELTKESPHHASGNYGLQDQAAALQWVRKNIASFGGDRENVTIFGESAGSFSVSALMASPTSKALLHRAIGESGAFFGRTLTAKPLAESEQDGVKFAQSIGADTLEKLRGMAAQQTLDAASKD